MVESITNKYRSFLLLSVPPYGDLPSLFVLLPFIIESKSKRLLICIDFFLLPVLAIGKEVKGNLPNSTQMAKNKLTRV